MKILKFSFLIYLFAFFSCSGPVPYVAHETMDESAPNDISLFFEDDKSLDSIEEISLTDDVLVFEENTEQKTYADSDHESLNVIENEFGNLSETSEDVAELDSMNKDAQEQRSFASNQESSEEVWNTYHVEKNDTLMLIAFKLYGDYSKWKDLYAWNKVDISSESLPVGAKIRYQLQGKAFVWVPKGNPHLILKGETLGVISKKYYNTSSKWRTIWDNNREMIKNPDLIFSGFTLYYIPEAAAVSSVF